MLIDFSNMIKNFKTLFALSTVSQLVLEFFPQLAFLGVQVNPSCLWSIMEPDPGMRHTGKKNWLVVWNMNFIFPFSWECHHPN